jgi:hypothetical protein
MKNLSLSRCLILIILILISCEKPDKPLISEDPNLLNDLYSLSNDTLKIGNKKYFIETYLSRDFFPGVPIRKSSPLIAVIHLIDFDSTEIATDIDVSKLYVININSIWISKPEERQSFLNYKLENVSTNGPEWETGIFVDVVAEISNNTTQDKSLIIKKHQYIERTE